MVLNIIDTLEEWISPFKNFIMKNHDNPIMWFLFLLCGIALFSVVFGALHRNGD